MLRNFLSGSIGVIGGADGPTAILVTGSFIPEAIAAALLLIAVIAAVIIIRIRKKHK